MVGEWLDVTPAWARGKGGFRVLSFGFDGGDGLVLERLNANELFMPPPGATQPPPRWVWQVSFAGDRPLSLHCEDEAGAAQQAAFKALAEELEKRLLKLSQVSVGPQERRPLAR